MSCSPSSVGAVEAVEAAIDYAVGLVGIKALKPFQRDAIRTFVGGRDVFVSLPTGFGKSLCYAFLPTVCDAAKEHQLLSAFPKTATTLL